MWSCLQTCPLELVPIPPQHTRLPFRLSQRRNFILLEVGFFGFGMLGGGLGVWFFVSLFFLKHSIHRGCTSHTLAITPDFLPLANNHAETALILPTCSICGRPHLTQPPYQQRALAKLQLRKSISSLFPPLVTQTMFNCVGSLFSYTLLNNAKWH